VWGRQIFLIFQRGRNRLGAAGALIFMIAMVSNCGQSAREPEDQWLLRVRDREVSVYDYQNALEIQKTAYESTDLRNPAAVENAMVRLLNQFMEESILLERAEDVGVTLSEAELEQAVEDIRGDYPEGEFERLFMEHAVSFRTWKRALKTRLIMEKVIARELRDESSLKREDVGRLGRGDALARTLVEEGTGPQEVDEEAALQLLRRQKQENAYDEWFGRLREQYPVEINQKAWDKLLDSHGH
jgi:hypothetical protein